MIKIKKVSAALILAGLSVASLPAFSMPVLSTELIQNGGFESFGDDIYSITAWNTAEDGILGSVLVENDSATDASGRNTVGAASGSYYGLLDSAAPSNQALYQTFNTGAVSSATLSFQMFINNQSSNGTQIHASGLDYTTGGSFDSNQHVRVDLLSAGTSAFSTNSADILQSLYLGGSNGSSVIGGDVANPYLSYSFNLSSILATGGAYTLRFASVTNDAQMQFGIDNVSLSVTPVPEPETYAMFLAGLGLMGFVARRRNKA